MKLPSTHRTRLNAIEAMRVMAFAGLTATALAAASVTSAHAQALPCPSYLLRPDVAASVNASVVKLRRSLGTMSSNDVAMLLVRDLKAELRLRLPREVMQVVRSEIETIDRAALEGCLPPVATLLKQADEARGLTEELKSATADAARVREQESAAALERELQQRRAAIAAARAETEKRQQALEAEAREREEALAKVAAEKRETEAKLVERSKASANGERQLYASYRSLLVVQSCYDSLAGGSKVYVTGAQRNEAQSLTQAIQGKLTAGDASLNKDAIFASAKQEEERLGIDAAQLTTTARGGIARRSYDEGSKAFCDAQLTALRDTAKEIGAVIAR